VILVKGNTEFERYFGDIHREIIEEREKASTADYTAMWWREFERFFVLTFMDKGFDLEMFFEGSFNPHPIDESEVMYFRKNKRMREYMNRIIDVCENSPVLKDRFPSMWMYRKGIDEIAESEHTVGMPKTHTFDENEIRAQQRLKRRKERKLLDNYNES
jgi:hypothetical protein